MYCIMDHQWGNDYPELRGIYHSFDKALHEINSTRELRNCTIEFRELEKITSGTSIDLKPIGWLEMNEKGMPLDDNVTLDEAPELDEVMIVAKYGQFHRIDDSGCIIYRDSSKNNAFVVMFQPIRFISMANNVPTEKND